MGGRESEMHASVEARFARAFGSHQLVHDILEVPGRIIHIDSLSGRSSVEDGSSSVYWATRGFYHRFLLGWTMFKDHIPTSYLEKLSAASAVAEAMLGP